jgi:hypothetical protein
LAILQSLLQLIPVLADLLGEGAIGRELEIGIQVVEQGRTVP